MISINVKSSYVNIISAIIFIKAYYLAVQMWSGNCPECHRPYHRHGRYTRKTPYYLGPIYIQRVYCKNCKKTHALLPCYIIPYSRVLAIIQQIAIQDIAFKRQTIEAIAELFELDPSTILRWWITFRNKTNKMLEYLSSLLAQPPHLTDWGSSDIDIHRQKACKILELMKRCRDVCNPDFAFCEFSMTNLYNPYLLSGLR